MSSQTRPFFLLLRKPAILFFPPRPASAVRPSPGPATKNPPVARPAAIACTHPRATRRTHARALSPHTQTPRSLRSPSHAPPRPRLGPPPGGRPAPPPLARGAGRRPAWRRCPGELRDAGRRGNGAGQGERGTPKLDAPDTLGRARALQPALRPGGGRGARWPPRTRPTPRPSRQWTQACRFQEATPLSHTHTPSLSLEQARLLLLPWTLALTASASAVGLAARSLTALGFTPPGCAPADELAASVAALEAARRREEGYRAKVAALAAECEAVARDRRRAAAKLARARAELEAVKGEGGAAAGGGDASGAGASATPPRPWPPSPGGRLGPDSGDWAADDDPAAAATTTITTRSLALAFSALAVCAAWWARAGPPYPALSHKAILAAAGPLGAHPALLPGPQPAGPGVAAGRGLGDGRLCRRALAGHAGRGDGGVRSRCKKKKNEK